MADSFAESLTGSPAENVAFKRAWIEFHQRDPDWAPPPSWHARVRAGCSMSDVRGDAGRRPDIGSKVPCAMRFVLHRQTSEDENSQTQEMRGDVCMAGEVFLGWLRGHGVRVLARRISKQVVVAPYVEDTASLANKLVVLMAYIPPVDLTPLIAKTTSRAIVVSVDRPERGA